MMNNDDPQNEMDEVVVCSTCKGFGFFMIKNTNPSHLEQFEWIIGMRVLLSV